MVPVLAAANFDSPLFWAAFIGWILSVVLHEFAHGVVALWGGDYTIRERGGTSLNPLQYVDPVTSLLLPAVFLAIGGVPLPGGVNYVRLDLLRSRGWASAVSLAGPAMNLLLFAAGVVALHPRVGWVAAGASAADWTPAQQLVGTLAVLQIFAALLNLLPVPPLDGFGAISPFLRPETRLKLTTPPASVVLVIMTFVLVMSPQVQRRAFRLIGDVLARVGYDDDRIIQVAAAFNLTLFGR